MRVIFVSKQGGKMKSHMITKKKNLTVKAKQVIEELKSMGVKFTYCNEESALDYLKKGNHRKLIPLYVKNFDFDHHKKQPIDLDFAYLMDFARIDNLVKFALFQMLTMIEQSLKGRIIKEVEILDINGIDIVNEFLDNNYDEISDSNENRSIHQSIEKRQHDENVQKILTRYNVDLSQRIHNIPVEDFVDLLTFGELISLFDFYTKKYHLHDSKYVYLLSQAKKLRNAVDHDQCILINLNEEEFYYHIPSSIVKYLKYCEINKNQLIQRLKNPKIRRITFVFYLFVVFVPEDETKRFIKKFIRRLFHESITLHKKYYTNNLLLKFIGKFFGKQINKNFND